RSCTKCLRHYGNRFLHARLDRRLAVTMLEYLRAGTEPAIPNAQVQTETLSPLRRFLELEGWEVNSDAAASRPLVAKHSSGRTVVVGTHPCLMIGDVALATHSVALNANETLVLLPDYVVE